MMQPNASNDYQTAAAQERALAAHPAAMNFAGAEPPLLHPCYETSEFLNPDIAGFRALNAISPGLADAMRVFLSGKLGVEVAPDMFAWSLSTFRVFRALLAALPVIDGEGGEPLVLLPQGGYYLFRRIAGDALRSPQSIATLPVSRRRGYKIHAEDIADWAADNGAMLRERPALLVFENPSTLGHVYDADELRGIAAVCAEHGVTVLNDEVYRETRHPGADFVSLHACAGDAARIVTVMALSKGHGNLQYSLAPCAMSPDMKRELMRHIGDDWRSTTLHHNAAIRAIVAGDNDDFLKMMRETCHAKTRRVLDLLKDAPVEIVHEPRAGYSVALDLTKAVTGGDTIDPAPGDPRHAGLFERFVDKGLVLPPLHASGIRDRLCFRLVYGKNPDAELERAATVVRDVIREAGKP